MATLGLNPPARLGAHLLAQQRIPPPRGRQQLKVLQTCLQSLSRVRYRQPVVGQPMACT